MTQLNLLHTLDTWICYLCGGHEYLWKRERSSVRCKCAHCGYETSGWSLEAATKETNHV